MPLATNAFLQATRRALTAGWRSGPKAWSTSEAVAPSMAQAAEATKEVVVESYNPAMQFWHWCTAAGVLTCFGTVQLAMNTEDKELKGNMMMIHKSTGLLVACLVVPRMATRMMSKLPAHYPGLMRVEEVVADMAHYTLYGMMVAMPATGIAMGYYGGKGLPFYGYHIPGAAETKPEIAKNAFKFHKTAGKAFELLVPGHVGAVGMHALRGQNVLGRMAAVFK